MAVPLAVPLARPLAVPLAAPLASRWQCFWRCPWQCPWQALGNDMAVPSGPPPASAHDAMELRWTQGGRIRTPGTALPLRRGDVPRTLSPAGGHNHAPAWTPPERLLEGGRAHAPRTDAKPIAGSLVCTCRIGMAAGRGRRRAGPHLANLGQTGAGTTATKLLVVGLDGGIGRDIPAGPCAQASSHGLSASGGWVASLRPRGWLPMGR